MPKRRFQQEQNGRESDPERQGATSASSYCDGGDAPSQEQKGPQSELEYLSQGKLAEAGMGKVNEETHEVAREMLLAGHPISEILELFAGAVDPVDLRKELEEVESRHGIAKVPTPLQHSPPSSEWEDYDEYEWNAAAEGEDLDLDFEEHVAPTPAPATPDQNMTDAPERSFAEPAIVTSATTFVRALEDSDGGNKPFYRRGDILRIIGHRRRHDLYYEVLPLKPPGEAGRAMRCDFEGADQAAVDEVGRQARTEKEIDAFRCAVEWED